MYDMDGHDSFNMMDQMLSNNVNRANLGNGEKTSDKFQKKLMDAGPRH